MSKQKVILGISLATTFCTGCTASFLSRSWREAHAEAKSNANAETESTENLENLKLKQVQIYFRHGARTPLHLIPKVEEAVYNPEYLARDLSHTMFEMEFVNLDGRERQPSPYEKAYSKLKLRGGCRSGMLTSYGQDQTYSLGKELRKDYIEKHKLITENFNSEEVYIRSTNMNRTTDSLRCVMAGLFGAENLRKNGPIRVPISHSTKEYLFPNPYVCHVLRQINHAALIHGSDIPEFVPLRQKLEEVVGLDPSKGDKKVNFIDFRDDLVARKAHGLPLPEHITPYLDQIDESATKLITYSFAGQHDAERMLALRLAMGRAMNLVLSNMENVQSRNRVPKLYLYSGHDTTILPMLEVLDIDDKRWPPFAADLRYEIYEDEAGDHWVQVKYLGKPRLVRGCRSKVCPLRDFKNAIMPFTIKQKEYEDICASNILEKIAKDILEMEVGEVEDAETKERSDIAAGM